jgi:hypothetical protein
LGTMGQIHLFTPRHENAFDTEATATLTVAYERAIAGLPRDRDPGFVPEIIAKRIIAIARTGERDPDRLCNSALASIGLSKQTTGEDR